MISPQQPAARSRWSSLVSVLVALVLVQAPDAQNVAPGFSTRFDPPGLNARVFGLGTWQGELYAGGPFDFLTGGGEPEHIARFDGQDWLPVGGGTHGPVRALVEYQGDLVVGGDFVGAAATPASGIVRWDGSRWWPLGQGTGPSFAREVFALCVFQGELYAGGRFQTAGGISTGPLARWDGTRWSAVGGGVGGSSGSKVLALAVSADGSKLYVGGEFASAGGRPATNVAAWNGSGWQAFGSGLGTPTGSGVHAVREFGGQLYAGGNFRNAGSAQMLKVSRWDGSNWRSLGLGIPDSSISTQVNDLVVHENDLYVLGSFGYVDATTRGAGIRAQGIARWDGSVWSGIGNLYRNAFGGQVYGIAGIVHGGRLVVGGDFDHGGPSGDHANNVVSADCIAWDGVGFRAVGEGFGMGDGASKLVRWRGNLHAVPSHLYAGTAVSPGIARFDGADWSVVGPFESRTRINDAVVLNNDLYVAGDLFFVNGQRMTGVIRYDGSSWTSIGGPSGDVLAVHGGELYCGHLNGVQRFSGGSWTRLPSISGYVRSMLSWNGRLYVGGASLGLTLGANTNLIVWDGARFAPVGAGADGTVSALLVHGGRLWIGGAFQTAGGVTSPRLVRFDGSRFSTFPGPGIGGASVDALAAARGALFVGGSLGLVGGVRTTLARWDGSRLEPLGTGTNVPPSHLLGDDATGQVWITGGFTDVDGITSRGVAVWNEAVRWRDLGHSLPWDDGTRPVFDGYGALAAGGRVALRTAGFRPGGVAAFVFGTSTSYQSIFGGTLVPNPDVGIAQMASATGSAEIDLVVPPGLPVGLELHAQVWALDPSTGEAAASNAVVGR